MDVLAVLTESVDSGAYWRKLKERLKAEGNETVTICHSLKMKAADGKMRQTAVADAEQLLKRKRLRGGTKCPPPWNLHRDKLSPCKSILAQQTDLNKTKEIKDINE